jgi:hypothetical protein
VLTVLVMGAVGVVVAVFGLVATYVFVAAR